MTRKRRPLGVPAWLAAGLHQAEKERKAAVIARPMRAMFALLATGEVLEIDGSPVMRMPEIDDGVTERAQWCAIAPAIEGWIDCWQRLAPDISLYHLRVLAQRLANDKPITPRLVEQAREEFEATIRRIVDLPDDKIRDALLTTRIAWELEKLQEKRA